jgi:hypothetical protein
MHDMHLLPAAICIALCFAPAWLLRQKVYPRAEDYFVSSEHTPSGVIQNSSIAYGIQVAIFAPLFIWGASGNLWPAIIGAVCFGAGLFLLYFLRDPILQHLHEAFGDDRSMTMHAFIARQHGDDSRVRLIASSVTVFAFSGLVVTEALAVGILLSPLFGDVNYAFLSASCMLLLMGIYTILSGNSGVLRSTQLQLGMIYLGLVGTTALLLYQLFSDLSPIPQHGTLAIVFVAACCGVILCYRRSRYVDTSPFGCTISHPDVTGSRRKGRGARAFIRFEKILNVCISVLAVFVIVIAMIGLSGQGLSEIVRDSATALQRETGMSTMELLALVLLPLFYPIVDFTNWHRMAAFEKDSASADLSAAVRAAALRRIFGTYAVESVLIFIFISMLGAISVVALATPEGPQAIQLVLKQLATAQNSVATAALSLLLVVMLTIAVSTMSSLFSAILCAIRFDVLPLIWPKPDAGRLSIAEDAAATRHTIVAGGVVCVTIFAALYAASNYHQTSVPTVLVALVVAFHCTQLALTPLVLRGIIGRTRTPLRHVSPGWAIAIIGCSATIGVGLVAVYITTGQVWWLWAAIPGCLGSGFLVFALAQL